MAFRWRLDSKRVETRYKFFAWWLNYARLDAPYTPLHEKYAPRVLELLVKQGATT